MKDRFTKASEVAEVRIYNPWAAQRPDTTFEANHVAGRGRFEYKKTSDSDKKAAVPHGPAVVGGIDKWYFGR